MPNPGKRLLQAACGDDLSRAEAARFYGLPLPGLEGYPSIILCAGPMKPKRLKRFTNLENVALADRSQPGGRTFTWWAHAAVVLALLLANLALYHGTIGLGFLSVDDPDYVKNNPHIESFRAANLKHILTRS